MIALDQPTDVIAETAWGTEVPAKQQHFRIDASDVGKPLGTYVFTKYDIGAVITVITGPWGSLTWTFLAQEEELIH